jgi:hypothetical protein
MRDYTERNAVKMGFLVAPWAIRRLRYRSDSSDAEAFGFISAAQASPRTDAFNPTRSTLIVSDTQCWPVAFSKSLRLKEVSLPVGTEFFVRRYGPVGCFPLVLVFRIRRSSPQRHSNPRHPRFVRPGRRYSSGALEQSAHHESPRPRERAARICLRYLVVGRPSR